jgi:four helix bundle protein
MHDHTSLIAWRESRAVVASVYRISTSRWSPPAGAIFGQLQRASLSVPLNLCEGYVWRPGRRWKHHLRIALGSAVESRECLLLLRDLGIVPTGEVDPAILRTRRVEALIWGLLHQR